MKYQNERRKFVHQKCLQGTEDEISSSTAVAAAAAAADWSISFISLWSTGTKWTKMFALIIKSK